GDLPQPLGGGQPELVAAIGRYWLTHSSFRSSVRGRRGTWRSVRPTFAAGRAELRESADSGIDAGEPVDDVGPLPGHRVAVEQAELVVTDTVAAVVPHDRLLAVLLGVGGDVRDEVRYLVGVVAAVVRLDRSAELSPDDVNALAGEQPVRVVDVTVGQVVHRAVPRQVVRRGLRAEGPRV